jgi:AraC-like DNA-binding protein
MPETIDQLLKIPEGLQRVPDLHGGITMGQNPRGFPKHRFTYVDHSSINVDLPLKLEFAGTDKLGPGSFRHIRERGLFAAELILEGDLAFRQDGQTFHVKPGGLVCFQPLAETTTSTGPSGHCLKQVVVLSGALLNQTLSRLGIRNLHQLTPASPERLERQMKGIVKSMLAPDRELSALTGMAYAFLVALSLENQSLGRPAELQQALTLIENRLNSSLRLDELVEECGQSRSALWRLFKQHFDCGPIAYYIHRKIQFSQHLLRQGGVHSIKEVSYNLGYTDPLYFSAEFKRHTGMSPTAYREQHLNDLQTL